MPRIFIISGTSYTLPADFNPGNNTVECYGGGGSGAGNDDASCGGGGGAYAVVNNINLSPGTVVQIQIGSGGSTNPATDTYFNASSLANAVSNGPTISCGAQGGRQGAGGNGNYGLGGSAASSCGSTKYSGGRGGDTGGLGGGGGGGCAGPNGPGANAGAGGIGIYGGGGGGGANNGSAGANDPSGSYAGGNGGNNRLGVGGGAGGAQNNNGGNGSAGGGGGGAGYGSGAIAGRGSLDDVYGTGVYGPGSGSGGGAWQGASRSAGGYGGGGGGSGNSGVVGGQQTDGLIVVTYTPAQTSGARNISAAPILTLRTPSIIAARSIRQTDPPPLKMDWLRQPADLLQPPPAKIIYRYVGSIPKEAPNPTPLYKPPWLQWPELLRHPVAGLDYRQQFPGKKPIDFFANLREDADTVSTGSTPVAVYSPINAALFEYDQVVADINPTPELGGSDDIIRRVKLLLPKGWWNFQAPIRDAIVGGIADVSAWCYELYVYARKQTRIAWATDLWLDIISKDYFRFKFPRRVNEPDAAFRARIQKELIRERVTRKGMYDALEDLTGKPPVIFEPWNTGDTGAWDEGHFAWDIGGGWGDTALPAQAFINVIPPGAGIPGAPGWDCAAMGWDIGGMWGDMNLIAGTITDQDIYDTINITRPTGAIMWTQLSAPQGPLPLPVQHVRTPSFAPPVMISPVVQPGPQRYSTMTTPPRKV